MKEIILKNKENVIKNLKLDHFYYKTI